ncbi:C39 family peptidase [Alicyclobacillus sp. ALC3]|uniref:C39 family peptidase n=1 Tax=Alicyclobacillus sp. ALC3 TaxID=2796143 RepID=UPI00237967EC|nr:C39 family peptidase [Alicyclobacillus sp. ALC3]WDL96217.1 C39 family peptidase [Alicyclobacillus sp. ALC3]
MQKHQRRRTNNTGWRVAAIVLAAFVGVAGGATVGFFRAGAINGYAPPAPVVPSNTASPTTKVPQRKTSVPNNAATAGNNTVSPTENSTGDSTANSTGNSTPSSNQTAPSNQTTPPPTDTSSPLPASTMLQVPAQNQLPQLPNGCEVTSLSMLFTAVGHPVSRFTLADEIAKDPTPLVKNSSGTIIEWGNPNVGFVGNMAKIGFGVYHGPIAALINQILPNRAVDLTGQSFDTILRTVAAGTPVEVWTNQYFTPLPETAFITWQSPTGPVHTTFYEHVVLVVGYDAEHIYIDNPLGGIQSQAVNRQQFIASWKQMGSQAVTIANAPTTTDTQSTAP